MKTIELLGLGRIVKLYPTVEEAVEEIKQASRRYAKRQLTWFRRNEAIRWLYVDETKDLLAAAMKLLCVEN